MRWVEVIQKHGTISGVSVREGRVASLLFAGRSEHADRLTEGGLVYVVPLRPTYQTAIRALRAAKDQAYAFHVFRKRAVDDWEDLGPHRVEDVDERQDVLEFRLAPAV